MKNLSTERANSLGKAMDLATLAERALGSRAVPPGAADVIIKDVCDDSREVAAGTLFVAVSGGRFDGARYIQDAIARGAAAVVVDRGGADAGGRPVIKVPNARPALARLAAVSCGVDALQASGELRVAAVTGTNGKSTTAYMLRSLLRAAGRTVALMGTIEYDLVDRKLPAELTTPGPVALARHLVEAHSAGARDVVIEASSHSLHQCRTDGIDVSPAVFTNLSQDHLDYHHSIEDYLAAKRRLFDRLRPDATAVINADDPAADKIVKNCKARIIRYGLGDSADVRAEIVTEDRSGGRFVLRVRPNTLVAPPSMWGRLLCGTGFQPVSEHRRDACATGLFGRAQNFPDGTVTVHTPLVGRHNILNALAAASAGLAMGLDRDAIRRGLADLDCVPGRLQRVQTGSAGFDVFVDYAHTDDALRHVLRAVRAITRDRLWCVFGCGGDRDRTKRPLMAKAVAEGADAFVITSDNPRTEDPLAIIADIHRGLSQEDRRRSITQPDRAEAIACAVGRLTEGDTLVIAGKGHEDYQILGTRKVPFDDVEVARGAVARRETQPACEH